MLPPRTDPRWTALVERPGDYSYEFLALRILMQRVALRARRGVETADRHAMADEVYGFFEKNQSLMANDVSALFG